jgi:DNA-binding LacI/PurR family transcriptional regulator
MPRATIADVAARAGVNKATVSHTLSGKRPVSAEARARVEQAIQELGYAPNPVAQRLAGGVSRTVGLAYPLYGEELGGLEMKFISGAASALNREDYAFMLLTHPERQPSGLERLVRTGMLDGLLLMQVRLRDPRIDILRAAGAPFVLIGRPADTDGIAYIDLDIERAMEMSVDHLADLGHRELGYLRMEETDLGFSVRAKQAYEAACERRGLVARSRACELSMEDGRDAALALLAEHPATTAVLAWNDLAGWGAMQAAESAGRRIPDDFAIMCFDNSTVAPLAPFRPTNIDIRPHEMAARAAEMLLDMLRGRSTTPPQVLLAPRLIEGSTTVRAPVPTGRVPRGAPPQMKGDAMA